MGNVESSNYDALILILFLRCDSSELTVFAINLLDYVFFTVTS